MILYHGTSSVHLDSFKKGIKKDTWFALYKWYGFQLAERTSKRDGGESIVLEVDIQKVNRIIGRNKPSFQYKGGKYKILNILKICEFNFWKSNYV